MKNHLFIGLGGQGGNSIAELRKVITQRKEDMRSLEEIRSCQFDFLYIDSSTSDLNDESEWTYFGEDLSLDPQSIVNISNAGQAFDIDSLAQKVDIAPWIGDKDFLREITQGAANTEGAHQQRRFGRLLFAQAADDIVSAIESKVAPLEASSNQCAFHIFASLAGGTGSGGIVDIVSILRKKYPSPSVIEGFPIFLYLYVTDEDNQGARVGYFHQNQYAALRDLNAMMCGQLKPTMLGSAGGMEFEGDTPINLISLSSSLSERNQRIPLEKQKKIMAESVFERIYSYCSGSLNSAEQKYITGEDRITVYPHEPATGALRSFRFSSIGMQRWDIPKEKVRELMICDSYASAYNYALYNKWDKQTGFIESQEAKVRPHLLEQMKMECIQKIELGALTTDVKKQINIFADQVVKGFLKEASSNSDLRDLEDLINKKLQTEGISIQSITENSTSSSNQHNRLIKLRKDINAIIYDNWFQEDDETKVSGLIDIPPTLTALREQLSLKYKDSTQKSEEGDKKLESRINLRHSEWNKTTFLSAKIKRPALIEAHKHDLIQRLFGSIYKTSLDHNTQFKREALNLLVELKSEYESTTQKIKSLAEEKFEAGRIITNGLEDLEQGKHSNRNEIDTNELKSIRNKLTADKELSMQLVKDFKLKVFKTLVDENTVSHLSKLKDKQLIALKHLGDQVGSTQLEAALSNIEDTPSSLTKEIMGLLESKYINNEKDFADEVKQFIKNSACLVALDKSQLQPRELRNDSSIPPMPRKSLIVGLPKEHAFNKKFIQIFKTQVPAGEGYSVASYEHDDKTQVRLLVTVSWLAARFTKVVQKLQGIYNESARKSQDDLKVYFPNIDPSGQAGNRPSLLLPSPSELTKMLKGALWLGQRVHVVEGQKLIQASSSAVALITESKDGGLNTQRLGDSIQSLTTSADVCKISIITDNVAAIVSKQTETTLDQLRTQLHEEEKKMRSELSPASEEYEAWSLERNYISSLLIK